MISRPFSMMHTMPLLGHREEPLGPLPYQSDYVHGPEPIRRTASFAFAPRPLPPVNKVKGAPRLYG